MTKAEFTTLLDRYAQGIATPEETQLFDLFVVKMAKQAPDWELEERERIKLEIYTRIKRQIVKPKPATKIIRMPVWVRVAASIAIILTLSIYFIIKNDRLEYRTVSTDYGERDTILLADGSRIYLNAGSQLTFPTTFKGKKRAVSLQGEAFFEVARNPSQPFEVTTYEVRTTVLGTSFNIQAFPQEKVTVTVATGKVKVNVHGYANNPTVFLSPNQQAIFDASRGILERRMNVKTNHFIAWKAGFIQFDNTSLSEAIVTLKKWYNVDIQLENPRLAQCRISGKYAGDNLKNVLESIQFITSVQYKFKNAQEVILLGKPCGTE